MTGNSDMASSCQILVEGAQLDPTEAELRSAYRSAVVASFLKCSLGDVSGGETRLTGMPAGILLIRRAAHICKTDTLAQ